MASRWRQWSYDTHVNISSKSNIAMVQPVNHSVGRGRLHLLAEKVSMPQLDMPARSPGSSKVRPPTRGMGRADLLRSRLQRNNEARLPGVKVTMLHNTHNLHTCRRLITCVLYLFKQYSAQLYSL